MQVSNAIKIWLDYHKSHSRDNTIKAYPATQLATKTDISSIHLSGGIVRISQNCKAMIFTQIHAILEFESSMKKVPKAAIKQHTIKNRLFR